MNCVATKSYSNKYGRLMDTNYNSSSLFSSLLYVREHFSQYVCGTVRLECVCRCEFLTLGHLCAYVCIPIHKRYATEQHCRCIDESVEFSCICIYICVCVFWVFYSLQHKSFISSMKFVRYKHSAPKIEHKQNADFTTICIRFRYLC